MTPTRSDSKASGEEGAPHAAETSSEEEAAHGSSWVLYATVGAVGAGFAVGLLGYGDVVTDVFAKLVLPLMLLHSVVQHVSRREIGAGWLRGAIQRQWAKRGGGFYGLVALLTFGHLEARTLWGEAQGAWQTWQGAPPLAEHHAFMDFASEQLWGAAIGSLLRVSVESILNAVWAGLWPVRWVMQFGVWEAAVLAGVAYATYAAARRFVPAFRRVSDDAQAEAAQAEAAQAPEADEGRQEERR